ncbi:alkylphosphonate utilization protein [Vibrio sp. 10N.286.49.C2]|uniref:PhnA domain-containing protein n=1 Tax=unclassified Vibrio TaxID=2614977 RepID=UPI000C85BCB8|nr:MULTISPECIES: alkylphosphonate utilization protein [unclassified Vibrio]PMH34782.1 alkylphosphonate utilization protein [Vibrio sp. 10N.286.49.C2]PMH51430.1 alkylphosphonate utilization protein [Vibrio sp. 10N.286.49.B1]PMH79375.1 alkylphosphonate utilization protein [Vibrio sp. 10N.286.48.B7]
MSTEATMLERCGNKCELCAAETSLSPFVVAPHSHVTVDHAIMLCETCSSQIENPESMDVNHWRCLNDSMWSQVAPVQVVAFRQLHRLSAEGWAQDLLDMMYMEEEVKTWAETGLENDGLKHVDCHGAPLQKGDTVTIIKDLPVKGSSMVVKIGTMVRNIGLAQDDPELFSGKVEGQSMWLRCEYCRKK